MTISEFELIEKYFCLRAQRPPGVIVGVGDDCALLEVPADKLLAVTTDTLVAGVHFLPGADPRGLGHKSLAVSLSDLAAMGATPAWLTLSLTLPEVDPEWLEHFAAGFFALAQEHQCALVGGNMSRGPLTVTVQAHGLVPARHGLRRSGTAPGDVVMVTGTLGDAGLGLAVATASQTCSPAARSYLLQRLERPTPRVEAGKRLLSLASAAIDVSDGLAQDLKHVLESSAVGATINADALPLSTALTETLSGAQAQHLALTAGDDYELCFTCSRARLEAVRAVLADCETRVTEIGVIEREAGLRVVGVVTPELPSETLGYRHF